MILMCRYLLILLARRRLLERILTPRDWPRPLLLLLRCRLLRKRIPPLTISRAQAPRIAAIRIITMRRRPGHRHRARRRPLSLLAPLTISPMNDRLAPRRSLCVLTSSRNHSASTTGSIRIRRVSRVARGSPDRRSSSARRGGVPARVDSGAVLDRTLVTVVFLYMCDLRHARPRRCLRQAKDPSLTLREPWRRPRRSNAAAKSSELSRKGSSRIVGILYC